MKKHKIKTCFMLILAFLSLFTGCMSREEKQKASEYVNEAKPYLTQYLSEHYPDAVSKTFENVTKSSYDLFVTTYASPAVRMTYEDDGREYHIVYNVDTGSYYEDRACDEITRSMWKKLQETCDFYDLEGWEVCYNWYNGNEGFSRNYYRAGENTLEALLNGDYEFTVTVSYEETSTDLSSIDLTAFEENYNLTFLFTDYVKGRYQVDSSENSPYAIRQYRKEVLWKDPSEERESSYQKYDHLSIYDMEFVWPSKLFTISATTEDAPRELVPGTYSGATFTSIDGVQVRLHVQAMAEEYSHARIYVFFPMEREAQQLLIGTESSGEYDNWRLDWREDDHIYRYLTTDERDFIESESIYTFGYYEK